MKISHDYPYIFMDYREEIQNPLKFNVTDNTIELNIQIPDNFIHFNVLYAIEIDCSQTFFRKLYIIDKDDYKLEISKDVIGDSFEYSILMIAEKSGEIKFSKSEQDIYEEGDFIGIIDKNTIYLVNKTVFSGLIKVSRSLSDEISYDLSSDWITIELPSETFEKFIDWQSDDSSTPFALASLGKASLQYALLMALKNETLKEKLWFQIISNEILNKLSIEEIEDNDVPQLSNFILGDCIQKMLNAALPSKNYIEDTSILA